MNVRRETKTSRTPQGVKGSVSSTAIRQGAASAAVGVDVRNTPVAECHNVAMPAMLNSLTAPETARRVIRIQQLTLVWMTVEAGVALAVAWIAHSTALLGFGGDSAIELLSALVVLRRFYHPAHDAHAETKAARTAGVLLFVLAGFVVFAAAWSLLGHVEAQPSWLGIVELIVAAIVMPWLARQKRRLSAATCSAALRADATESAVCGYMALIALAGLGLNAIWGIRWADPLAALLLLPLIVYEGVQAMKGKPCCD